MASKKQPQLVASLVLSNFFPMCFLVQRHLCRHQSRKNLRKDEGTFRGLIQDNEELFDTWMILDGLAARQKFAMSLEELQLSDDNDFAKQQERNR